MKPSPLSLLGAALLLATSVTASGCEEEDSIEEESSDFSVFGPKPIGPEPSGQPARYPIVFEHGFGVTGYDDRILDALRADGHMVYKAQVPPYNSIEVRADYLKAEVDAALSMYGAQKVHIIAHSTGGLDARAVVWWKQYGPKVSSVTTIATPHRGTPVADFALTATQGAPDETLNAIAAAWGVNFNDLATDTALKEAFHDLSIAGATELDAMLEDDYRTMYQSYAGVSGAACLPNPKDSAACDGKMFGDPKRADCMDPILLVSGAIVAGSSLKPNDGLVSVDSAKHGDFKGCLPADHADEVGQFGDKGMDKHTGFDAVRFYRNLAFDLARYDSANP